MTSEETTIEAPKVYVAAPQLRVERARKVAEALRVAGYAVVSRWHAGAGDVNDRALSTRAAASAWTQNQEDLAGADAFVALTDERCGREVYCEIARAIDGKLPIVWSLADGGECVSLHAPGVPIVPVRSDAEVPGNVRAILRGFRSMTQLAIVKGG